mgnify:CR=1 FL=1
MTKIVTCPHPDRPYYAKNRCRACYFQFYSTQPQVKAKLQRYLSKYRYEHRFERIRRMGLTKAQHTRLVRKAGGRCRLCGFATEHLRLWRLDQDRPICGLCCYPCRKRLHTIRSAWQHDDAWMQHAMEWVRRSAHHTTVNELTPLL